MQAGLAPDDCKSALCGVARDKQRSPTLDGNCNALPHEACERLVVCESEGAAIGEDIGPMLCPRLLPYICSIDVVG